MGANRKLAPIFAILWAAAFSSAGVAFGYPGQDGPDSQKDAGEDQDGHQILENWGVHFLRWKAETSLLGQPVNNAPCWRGGLFKYNLTSNH